MVMAQGSVVVAAAGNETTNTGLASRLYSILTTTINAALTAANKPTITATPTFYELKAGLANSANDWAEWMHPPVHDLGSVSGDITFNFLNGHHQKVTLTGPGNFLFTNVPPTGPVYLHIIQDGTGSRLGTWPAEAKFKSGSTDGTLSTTASARDVYTGIIDGGNLYFAVSKGY